MTTTFLLALLLAAPSSRRTRPADQPAPVQQLSDDELRSKAEAYLGGIDTPISAERWKTLGPRAALVLEPVVLDAQAMPSKRAKALEGLSFVAPDRAALLVSKLARDEEQPVVVRVAALHAAGRVLPAAKVVAELRPVLEGAREPSMRGVAAEVLSHSRGGCAVVRAQAGREGREEREAYHRALAKCDE